jgi:hypothetical protein
LRMVRLLITLWMIYNTPSHYKGTGVLPNSVAVEEGNRTVFFTMRPMVTLKQFNGCDRRQVRMDQQHCSYSTILM